MLNKNKKKEIFRNYKNTSDLVIKTYKENHENQTVDFVKHQIDTYCNKFGKIKMSIWDALKKLDKFIDESDPDLDLPQIYHAFQTAEYLRSKYPNKKWMALVGLIHDLGKVLSLPELDCHPQWCTVGDTFPVGCRFSEKIIFHKYFEKNPDNKNPKYDTRLGIYKQNCGLDNILFSFGHDEYLYQVLIHNRCKIPEEGLKIIRYHSFYAWHKYNAYEYLMSDDDYKIRKMCKDFSKVDLYTKDNDNILDIEKLKPYYQELIDEYFFNKILEF